MDQATARIDSQALDVARHHAQELTRAGARAVILVGSHARGDAGRLSDIDLHAIGTGPRYQLVRHEPFLVSISWRSDAQHRAAFDDIAQVGGAVPAWRSAILLNDPDGIAATLQQEAREWTWDRIGNERLNAYVAEWIYGFAEEVQKLVAARTAANQTLAAVQRSVLTLRLAFPLAVHHRLLFDTENVLWEHVNAVMGPEWTQAQSTAFGTAGESFADTCDAALQLFVLACRAVSEHLNADQLTVVNHALGSAGQSRLARN